MSRLTLFRLTLGLTLLSVSCSSSDNHNGSNAGGTGGGTSGGAGKAGSAAGSGKGSEGADCTADSDCGSGLNCIQADSVMTSATRATLISVCARKCTDDPDCKADEMCFSTTGKPANALCWSLATEANKPCGPADTSFCDPTLDLHCVVGSDDKLSAGVCVQGCEVASPSCPSGLTCLFSDGTNGVCAMQLQRGDSCGEDLFHDCAATDLCLSDGSGNNGMCFQDCTMTMKCDDGTTCMSLMDGTGASYCM